MGPCNIAAERAWNAYNEARDEYDDAMQAWATTPEVYRGDKPDEPEPPEQRFFPGDPLFCGRCLAAVRRSLLDLDVLAGVLAAQSDGLRGVGASEAKVSVSKSKPSLSPIADLLDRMLGDLLDVEDEWREACGYAPRDAREQRGTHRRSRTIGWLNDHLEAVLAHEDMTGFARTVFNWETVLRKMAKDDPASNRSPVRCPRVSCGERRVSWDPESRYYRCGACGNLLNEAEHDRKELEERELADAVEKATPTPSAPRRPLVPVGGEDTSGRA